MKKTLLGLMAATGLLFTACDTTPKDSTAQVTYGTFNLVNPLDGGEPTVAAAAYSFDFNLSQATVQINTSSLTCGSSKYYFTTDVVNYQQYEPYYGLVYFMKGMTANVNNSSTLPLKNARFLLTSNFAYAKPDWNPEHPGVLYNGNYLAPVVVASYQVGEDFTVKTFMTDSFYSGTTRTQYPKKDGGMETYENKDMYYRVLINIEKKTADVIMYKAKFSSSSDEPEKKLVYLKDLKVNFGNGKYTITGENITPQLLEGGKLEDYPSFNVDFDMTTTGPELVGAVMNYTVEHTMQYEGMPMPMTVTYTGNFSGDTVILPDIADYK